MGQWNPNTFKQPTREQLFLGAEQDEQNDEYEEIIPPFERLVSWYLWHVGVVTSLGGRQSYVNPDTSTADTTVKIMRNKNSGEIKLLEVEKESRGVRAQEVQEEQVQDRMSPLEIAIVQVFKEQPPQTALTVSDLLTYTKASRSGCLRAINRLIHKKWVEIEDPTAYMHNRKYRMTGKGIITEVDDNGNEHEQNEHSKHVQ